MDLQPVTTATTTPRSESAAAAAAAADTDSYRTGFANPMFEEKVGRSVTPCNVMDDIGAIPSELLGRNNLSKSGSS